MHHPQVVQSSIFNNSMKVKINGHTEPQLVPKILLQVSVRELHKNIVSNADNGGLKEARDEDDNIIISDSTLRSLFPPHLKKCRQDKKSCVVANVAYLPKLYIHNYFHGVIVIKKLKDLSQNSQNRRSGEKENHIYETYKNKFMPHGRHIYANAYDMAKSKICAYSQSDHASPHWKYAF